MGQEMLILLVLLVRAVASLALLRPARWFTRRRSGTKRNVGAYALGQPAVRYVRPTRRTH